MRSEKEIRNKRDCLFKAELKHAQYIQEMIADGETQFIDLEISRANAVQAERQTLDWVLQECSLDV